MIGWLVLLSVLGVSLIPYQALNCNASEEGDLVLHCYFKTELTANLLTLTQASISVLIGPSCVFD